MLVAMTETRFLAILDFTTSADDRDHAVAQLELERPIVTAMPGCVRFRVHPSIENECDVTVIHEWEDEDSFRSYLDSAAFARSGEVVRPLMTSAPLSRRFAVEPAETIG